MGDEGPTSPGPAQPLQQLHAGSPETWCSSMRRGVNFALCSCGWGSGNIYNKAANVT